MDVSGPSPARPATRSDEDGELTGGSATRTGLWRPLLVVVIGWGLSWALLWFAAITVYQDLLTVDTSGHITRTSTWTAALRLLVFAWMLPPALAGGLAGLALCWARTMAGRRVTRRQAASIAASWSACHLVGAVAPLLLFVLIEAAFGPARTPQAAFFRWIDDSPYDSIAGSTVAAMAIITVTWMAAGCLGGWLSGRALFVPTAASRRQSAVCWTVACGLGRVGLFFVALPPMLSPALVGGVVAGLGQAGYQALDVLPWLVGGAVAGLYGGWWTIRQIQDADR